MKHEDEGKKRKKEMEIVKGIRGGVQEGNKGKR